MAAIYMAVENGQSLRVVAAGQTTVASGATVTIATASRNPGERLLPAGYVVTNIAGANWNWSSGAGGSGDAVNLSLSRTAVPDQFTMDAKNTGSAARTVDWTIFGVA